MDDMDFSNTYPFPEKYGDSKIVLIAKDPNCLFAYWELPNSSLRSFMEELGKDLWSKSMPALKVKNISKNESFFIIINELASNWYINVDDPNCLYEVEFGRKVSENLFFAQISSNYVITPGNTVSTNTAYCFTDYRDFGKFSTNYYDIDRIYEMFNLESYYTNLGISSLEFHTNPKFEQCFGFSSLEFYR